MLDVPNDDVFEAVEDAADDAADFNVVATVCVEAAAAADEAEAIADE